MDAAMPQGNDRETIDQVIRLLEALKSPEHKYMNELMRQIEGMESQIKELNAQLDGMRAEMRDQLSQNKALGKTVEGIYQEADEKGNAIRHALQELIQHIAQRGREWLSGVKQKGEMRLYSFLERSGIPEKMAALQQSLEENILTLEKNIQRLDSIENEFRQSGRHLKNAVHLIGGKETDGTEVKNTHIFSKIPRLRLKAYKGMLDRANKAIRAHERLENSVAERNPSVMEKLSRFKKAAGSDRENAGMETKEEVEAARAGEEEGKQPSEPEQEENGRTQEPEVSQQPGYDKYSELMAMAIRNGELSLQHVNVKEQTPKICMAAMHQDGRDLKYVKEQTPEICIAAVNQYGRTLEYVKEQTPKICMAAVNQNGNALEYVKEQTPEICMAAVSQDGNALKYVKEQTPEICIAAVNQYGRALEYVKEQTPEICMAAVSQDGNALKYVKEQTPEICMAAVSQDGNALEYVKEQTPEICMAAVNQYNGALNDALKYVKEQTPEICTAAVHRYGNALEHVKEQTPEICMAAVSQDGNALKYVKEQTPEICMAAVSQDGRALEYVKEQTSEICMAAVRNKYAIYNANKFPVINYADDKFKHLCVPEYLKLPSMDKEQFQEALKFLKANGAHYDVSREKPAWYVFPGKDGDRVKDYLQQIAKERNSVLTKLNQNKGKIEKREQQNQKEKSEVER